MLSVHLICVGKLKEGFYLQASAEYIKRLGPYCKLTLTELPEERLPQAPSPAQISAALERESAAIRARIPSGSSVIALCIEGRKLTSPELAGLVRSWGQTAAKHLVVVIGGSYGLSESFKTEAWERLSMSPMTFPHHLARVMALEQLYRAFKINKGSAYHK